MSVIEIVGGAILLVVSAVIILLTLMQHTHGQGLAGAINGGVGGANNARLTPADLYWKAPRFGTNDELESPAMITVVLNGIVVQIRLCFCHTGGNRTDTAFCYQFHADFGLWIYIFQIEDQLSQILNRINIMMGRGRN